MEQGGEFIGAHRPFADKGDWYGFLKEEIDNIIKNNEVALTEIHIDNLILFKELYGKNISSLALVADKEYLKYNLELRNSEVDEEKEIRLKKAETEIMNIKNLKNQKIIDILVEVNKNNRNELAEIVLDKIKKEMELDIKWENKIKFK
jgi:guanylate kinase